jgi:hypothetical protein
VESPARGKIKEAVIPKQYSRVSIYISFDFLKSKFDHVLFKFFTIIINFTVILFII